MLLCIYLLLLSVMNGSIVLGDDIGRIRHNVVFFSFLLSVASLFSLLLKGNSYRFSLVDLMVLLFGIWVCTTYFINGAIAEMRLLFFTLNCLLYFSLRIALSSDRKMVYGILFLLLFTGIRESWIGLEQLMGRQISNHSFFNITGTFYNPGPYGGYLAVIFSIAFLLIIAGYQREKKRYDFLKSTLGRSILNTRSLLYVVAVVTAVLTFILLPATQSRTAWIAIFVVTFIVILNYAGVKEIILDFYKKHKRLSYLGVIIGFLLVIISCYVLYGIKKDSANGRFLMWKVTALMIADNPATGVGLGHFTQGFAETQADYFSDGKHDAEMSVAGSPDSPFNEYLCIAAEQGLLGLALFMMIIFLVLKNLFSQNYQYKAFGAGLGALLIFSLASYPFGLWPFRIIFVIFCAAGGNTIPILRSHFSNRFVTSSIVVITLIISGLIYIYYKPFKESYKKWREASIFYDDKHFDQQLVDDYRELYPYIKDNFTFLFQYGHILNKKEEWNNSNTILKRGTRFSSDPMFYNIIGNNYKELGMLDSSAYFYQKAHDIIPSRMYPLYLQMKLYDQTGERESTINIARRIIEMKEKITSPATADMKKEAAELLIKYQ